MGDIRFTDGVTLPTNGPLRTIHLHDGWYVVGDGMAIPVGSREEAEQVIHEMKDGR